ncbi:hypothetical protein AB0L25_27015 [Spirillospora sp. NPDC052242]
MAHQTVIRPGLPDDPRAAVAAPAEEECPVEIAPAALRGRWTTLVVRELGPVLQALWDWGAR